MPSRIPSTLICALLALCALATRSTAQERDTTRHIDTVSTRDTVPRTLAPVVTVARERGRSPLAVPFAVTTMQPDSMRPGQMHTQLDETLLLVPGVVVQNRDNPSQDPRVSIRGFGARSAFGVRGVRILRDGMPLTMPDGQTAVDYLDLESVGRIEVFRGSASALYGNASGGVVDLHTEEPPNDPFAIQLRGWAGDYQQQRWTAAFGGTDGAIGYVGDINYTDRLGYRDYSRQIATSGYGKMAWTAGGTEYAVQVLGYDQPLGTNPGALTRAQADSAPWMADPLSVRKRARKTVSQGQLGLSGRHQLGEGQLSANVWGGTRDLFNPLTFAIVDVNWQSYGGGVRLDQRARFFGL
jgi:iron complex outermembrane receptor protein